MLAQFQAGLDSPVRERIRSRPNLLAYCDRMRQRYYGGGEVQAPAPGRAA
jgi:hypothetical protein